MKYSLLILTVLFLIGCEFTMTNSGSLVMKTSKNNVKEQAGEILNIVKENNEILQQELVTEFPEMKKEILNGSSVNVRRIQGMNDEGNDATIIIIFSINGSDMEKSEEIIESYEKKILPILIKNGFEFKPNDT